MRKILVCMLIALISFSLLISLSISKNLIVESQAISSLTLSSSGTILAPSTNANYVIYQSKGVIYVQNSSSGLNVYSDVSANQAFSAAFSFVSGGGSITVQAGTYIANDDSIRMEHCRNVAVTFQPGSLLTISDWANDAVFRMWYDIDCTVSGINVDGNGQHQEAWVNSDGVVLGDCSNCVVTGATITNCRCYGFQTGNNLAAVGNTNNGIVDSTVTFCGWNGIILGWGGPYTVGDFARNNVVAYCSDVGITNWGGTGDYIVGNYVHDIDGSTGAANSHVGIAVESGGYQTIEKNTIVNCYYGIGLMNSIEPYPQSNLVAYNNIINSSSVGISIADNGYDTVTQNQVTNWGNWWGAGIMNHASNSIISYNTLTNNWATTGFAIYSSSESGCSIINNNIATQISAGVAGILLEKKADSNLIEGNTIQAGKGIEIADSKCSNNIINQNNLNNCPIPISNFGSGTLIGNALNSILTLNCPSYYGTVNPSAGSYSESNSDQVIITLTPNVYYTPVLNVDGLNVTLTNNAYTLSMNRDHTVYAVFSPS